MISVMALVAGLVALLAPLVAGSMPRVAINASAPLTVGGISSGGFMAMQMHVSFSKDIAGAGILAGGPYWCAEDNVMEALDVCMGSGDLINADMLRQVMRNTALSGYADALDHLRDSRVWLFSAKSDSVITTATLKRTSEVYQRFLANPDEQIKEVLDVIDGEHSQITINYGNPCDKLDIPYLNACDYDAAGDMLQHLLSDTLTEPDHLKYNRTMPYKAQGQLFDFSQSSFYGTELVALSVGIAETGYVYVPPACAGAAKECTLHVSFHGCEMNEGTIGLQYIYDGGYLPWADANDIVIMFPQAIANGLNPKACWDWWAYSGLSYASNVGAQTLGVRWMMQTLMSQPLTPNRTDERQVIQDLTSIYSAAKSNYAQPAAQPAALF